MSPVSIEFDVVVTELMHCMISLSSFAWVRFVELFGGMYIFPVFSLVIGV